MIDPEINDTYWDKPPMSLYAYGPENLEFSDETNSFKEKDITISDFLLCAARNLISNSPHKFIKIG